MVDFKQLDAYRNKIKYFCCKIERSRFHTCLEADTRQFATIKMIISIKIITNRDNRDFVHNSGKAECRKCRALSIEIDSKLKLKDNIKARVWGRKVL